VVARLTADFPLRAADGFGFLAAVLAAFLFRVAAAFFAAATLLALEITMTFLQN